MNAITLAYANLKLRMVIKLEINYTHKNLSIVILSKLRL